VVVALVSGGVVVLTGGRAATSGGPDHAPTTAPVEKGTLSDMVALDGTLTHRARADGSPYVAINQARGTYTRLPSVGARVGCGDVLYRVDDRPVLLLCGSVPAYRDLRTGDHGRDVRQLNQNLHALGYDEPDEDRFTTRTRRALEQLQHDAGLDEAGELALDEVVFLPRPVRITQVTGTLGAPARPGTPVAQATSDRPVVQVSLDASQQGEVKRGDRALITLPGNSSTTGKVARIGRVASSSGQDPDAAAATLPAYVSLDEPDQVRGLDAAPVQVDITTDGVDDALSVPVTALVGTSGGKFAVEVVHDGGKRALVAVRLGLFDTAGGRVQVEGALQPGDDVVVPSP
jgi:peptidoglycan hydrolase-like protein with peptidoglycan-binding domain